MNADHAQKLLETAWLFWVFVLIGFDNGILGPCLPDLQSSVGASLEQMSFVFFAQGTGALLGNVLGFLLERRFDRRLLMAVYVLTGSLTNILIPLVPLYVYLLLLFLLQGLTKGLADFGAMSLCNVLWEEDKSLPFQFIVVGAGISTFVSPFIAQPFISQSAPSLPRSPHPFPSSDCCPGQHANPGNHTQPGISVGETGASVSGASSVIWPFVIVGVVTLPAAVAFLYLHFQQPAGRRPTVLIDVSPGSPGDEARTSLLASRPAPKDSRQVLIFRVLIVLLNVPVFGLLLTFADLLTSVGMTAPLCLSAVEASYFNTVLWGAAMIGRAVSAATLVCVPMFLQLLLCCVALVAVGAALVASGPGNVLGLWLGTAGVALFATPSMPGFIAWSGDHVALTPAFMNLCLCAAGVGEMLLPFLGGQLMAAWGSEAMLVFALLTMVTMLLLFLMAYYVTTRLPGRRH